MKRKFLSLLLAVVMLLTAFPMATVTMAEDTATSDVKLYDAHITGNVVIGGTLTANFEPADPDVAEACGLDMEKTKASIVWYYKNRYGARSSGTKTLNNDGNITYTVPSTYSTSNGPAIFFKITPKNADGDAIGDTVYSTISYVPQSIDSDVTAPVAYNAHISPLNGDGIIDVGETVAARYAFTYKKSASIGEMNSRYTWYTSDELLVSADDIESKATKVQDESTTATYTIKPADAGKYLYAKIIAVASDGAKAESAVYTKNHLGNGFLANSNLVTGHSVSATTDNCSGFNKQTGYPAIKLVADGCSPISNGNSPSTYVQAYNTNTETDRILTINAGKIINFDGIYLAYGQARLRKIVISYSNDNTNWTDIVVDSSCNYANPGEKEFLFDNVLNAQYFRLLVWSSNGLLNIDEFYPFLKNTTTINFTKPAFAQLNGSDIEVQAWGTPLSEVSKKANGFTVISDLDAEGSTAVADEIVNNAKFVTKSVTSDGDVYTAVANPENVKVNENLENTYLKVDDGKTVQYYLVKYAGNIVETEEDVITSAAGQKSSTLKFVGTADINVNDEGNAAGKYLLKTQIKLPKLSETSNNRGIRTTINAYQGSSENNGILVLNGWYTETDWGDSSWLAREIGIPKGGIHTGYYLTLDRWMDLEILFDFDSIDVTNGTINITTWIDGILVAEDVHPWTDPKTVNGGDATVLTPTLQLYPNNSVDMVYHKNSSFRQVWDADTHIAENGYELKVVNKDDETAAVNAVVAGDYTLSNNMNIYKGNSYVDYIAKYYVSADGSAELIDLAAVKSSSKGYVTVTADELADTDYKVVLKAFSFDNLLSPNYAAVAVTE